MRNAFDDRKLSSAFHQISIIRHTTRTMSSLVLLSRKSNVYVSIIESFQCKLVEQMNMVLKHFKA